jgi:glycosyltransferase involved in cell wall biosynthesis
MLPLLFFFLGNILPGKQRIMKKQSLISVIMPVYNASEYLSKAIESILWQTHTNWELICVNDGSTDNSLSILKAFAKKDKRIKVFSNKTKRGIGYSLNKALKVTQGKFIARMDADDISLADRFAKQVAFLNKNPKMVACGGQAAIIDPFDKIIAYKKFPTNPDILYKMIMKVVPLQHPILMARADVFKGYKYLENLPTAEDVDMLFYLLSRGKISNVDSVIYQYRKANLSNGYHNVKKTFFITFLTRINAIIKYHYEPSFMGMFISLFELAVISILPSKLIVNLFEKIRFEQPSLRKNFLLFLSLFSLNTKSIAR